MAFEKHKLGLNLLNRCQTVNQVSKITLQYSSQEVEDLFVLSLWAGFERYLRDFFQSKGEKIQEILPSDLADVYYEHLYKEIEYWKPAEILSLLKSSLLKNDQQRIELAEDVLKYRNWVAHGRNPGNPAPVYLERVEQLYLSIKPWLAEEQLLFVSSQIDVIEQRASYKTIQLSIKAQENKTLAETKPKGSRVLLGEGLVEIEGWLGKESLIYMIKDGLQMTKPDRYDSNKLITVPMYKGIDADGWYWIENSRRNRAHLLNKSLFLELITFVSDYEF